MKSILSFIFFVFFVNKIAFTQDSTSIQLEEVTVTASMQTDEIRQSARNISIITAKQIAEAPVKTLDGILQYALNVDVRSRSPFGVQSDISIRGGHFDQTLILVDGVKMNDPQTGHHAMNIPVPISQIEKIEVLQGGASRIFGPAAFSGVINIITKKVAKNSAEITGGIGQFGLKSIGVNGMLKKTKFVSQVAYERISSDGYAPKTAFVKNALLSGVTYYQRNNEFSLKIGMMSNDFEASNFYHPKFKEQYEEVKSLMLIGQGSLNHSKNVQSKIVASYRKHFDMYDFNNYRLTDSSKLNVHFTDVYSIEWKTTIRSKIGKTTLGIDYRDEKVTSNRLGLASDIIETVRFYPTVKLNKVYIRTNTSAYIEQQYCIKNIKIVGGALLNSNSQFGTKWYPGLDITYQVTESMALYSTANRSLRYPTFTELFLNSATVIGDINLFPESAWSYEIGGKFKNKGLFSTFSVFYRDTEVAIDKVLFQNETTPKMVNIENINFFGFEWGNQYVFDTERKKKQPLKSLQFNYSFLDADKNEVGYQSFYTLNYLAHKLTIGFTTVKYKCISLSGFYTFKKRQGTYQLDTQSPSQLFDPIHLVDARLQYSKSKFSISIDALNLLNRVYYEFGFVEMPKRWVSTNLTLRL